jgi:2,3-bisphosphoglycerate-independent phosphoglycerate mutase
MKLAVIAGTALIKGIGRLLGGDVIEVKGATGGKDTDLNAKVSATLKALEDYDFVLLHIKATDEYGHDGDFEGKRKFIEKVDKALEPLLSLDFSKVCLVVTADHSTPISVRDHTADPVPITIVYDEVRSDDVDEFSELKAYKGGLCRIRGLDLMNIILDLINKTKKFGA